MNQVIIPASAPVAPVAQGDDEPPSQPPSLMADGTSGSSRSAKPRARAKQYAPARVDVGQSAVDLGDPYPFLRNLPRTSQRTREFRKRFYSEISDREWNDWHWQIRNAIRTKEGLERCLILSEEEQAAFRQRSHLPLAITPYYLSLCSATDAMHPIRRTVVPTPAEEVRSAGEADDPLGEDGHSPVPGLVHRYPDRVLLLALDLCSTYCRYCTRSRVVGHCRIIFSRERIEKALAYIREHREIRDVLVSGGDPLHLSDQNLDWLLGELRRIPHVEMVRMGSKMPAVLPQRITPELVKILRRHHPLWMSLHFTHPEECTPESYRACARLADAGIPLGSQTVLLKGINDDPAIMKRLMHHLVCMRVRPYYIYQCDPITGSAHFRTPVAKGLEILQNLRGHTTGYAVPTYVIDAPGGGGKIPISLDTVMGKDGSDLLIRNYEGRTYRYPDHCV